MYGFSRYEILCGFSCWLQLSVDWQVYGFSHQLALSCWHNRLLWFLCVGNLVHVRVWVLCATVSMIIGGVFALLWAWDCLLWSGCVVSCSSEYPLLSCVVVVCCVPVWRCETERWPASKFLSGIPGMGGLLGMSTVHSQMTMVIWAYYHNHTSRMPQHSVSTHTARLVLLAITCNISHGPQME